MPPPSNGFAQLTGITTPTSTRAWAVSAPGPLYQWNGGAWALQTDPVDGNLADVWASSTTDAWAVGQTSGIPWSQHWNGSSWSAVSVPYHVDNEGEQALQGVDGVSSNDVWTVGHEVFRGQGLAPLAEHWNGTTWTSFFPPADPTLATGDLRDVDMRTSSDVWAVGNDDYGGNSFVEHWNGTAWSISTPSFPGQLNGVVAVAANNVWAVGDNGDPYVSGNTNTLILHYDGTTWTKVSSPNPGTTQTLMDVSAASARDIWAVGEYVLSDGTRLPLREHWDGTAWTFAPGPNLPVVSNVTGDFNILRAVTHRSGRWWAAGSAGGAQGVVENLCPQAVTDDGFTPPAPWIQLNPPRKVTAEWRFPATNTASHGVKDGSGLELFDSGLRTPGGSFTYAFTAAGSYPLVDTATGHTGQLPIPVRTIPESGSTSSSFTIVWAAGPASAGFVYDVKIKRPGSSTFQPWETGVTAPRGTFTPDTGAGDYTFIARLRSTADGDATFYSPWRAISVG